MATVIQVKRGTAAAWTSANTVLTAGEIGFESDTKKMKVGDGSTAWTSLAYTATDGDITAVVAGTGLSGGSTSGSATLAIDTSVVVDKTTAQTLTNKTLTSPVLTTPSISTMTTTGDILYASAANTPARLGIGSTDQVLKVSGGVPTWATSSSGAITKIGTYSFSGVTTYDIPNVFSSAYDHYLLIGDERSSSGGGLAFQLLVSGTPSTVYYSFGKSAVDYTGTHYPEGSSSVSKAQIGNSNSGGERGYFNCTLWNPFNAVPTHYWSQHTTNAGASKRQGFFAGVHDVGASYTGLRLSNNTSSNIAGNMYIYGIQV